MQQPRKPRILVVEDNEDVRQVITLYLGSNGFEIVEAPDGVAGLERAAEGPDLILLDVLLPKIDGIEMLRRLRETPHGRLIPVIMMSAVLQTRDLQQETVHLNVHGYVQKPFQLRALLEHVRAVTGGDAVAAPRVLPNRPRPGGAPPRRPPPAAPAGQGDAAFGSGAKLSTGVKRAVSIRHQRACLPPGGTLESMPVPFVLHSVFFEQRTGRLGLSAHGMDRAIFFSAGMPVFAESSIPEETLGAHLVRRGVIDQVQNAMAVTEMTRTGRRFGEILLRQGTISPHELFQEMELHLADKVIGCFGWHQGAFEFVDGDEWKDDVIIARMQPGRIIVSGCRRHWNDSLVRARLRLSQDTRCEIIDGSKYDDRLLALDGGETRILQLVRKGHFLSEISRAIPQPDSLLPFLFGLYVMEIVGFTSSTAVDERTDIASLIADAMPTRPPARPRKDDLASLLMGEYLKLRTADHFTLLGVSRNSTAEEIARAFNERKRRYHPDTLVGIDTGLVHEKLEELYHRVHDAYRTLTDPAARSRYISKLDSTAASNVPTTPPPPPASVKAKPVEPEGLFREGRSLLGMGEFGRAGEAFKAAHELDPDPRYLAYRVWAGYLASPNAERATAERELRILHNKHDDEPLYPYLLANFHQREGDARRAAQLYETALEIDPRHIDAARQLRILRMRQRASEHSGLFDLFKKG